MPTLREIMKNEMTLRGFSEKTKKKYIYEVTRLKTYYQRSPAKLNQDEIKAYLLYLVSERKIVASTYNVTVHALKFFYDVVLHRKISDHNFPLSKKPKRLPDVLSVTEVKSIINAASNIKHRAILVLAYGAGLRSAEIVKLKPEDIDSKRMQIHIRNGKGGKDRYVVLSTFMLDVLRTYWRKCRSKIQSVWLFTGRSSNPMAAETVNKIYKWVKKRTSIKKKGGVHSLRHAFATHSLEAGENLYAINQLLGHSSIKSTAHYFRLTNNKMQSIKSPIEALKI